MIFHFSISLVFFPIPALQQCIDSTVSTYLCRMEKDRHISGGKQVARNATFLFIRLLLVMAVTFYTSRLIYEALGVEDYGIYVLIGGLGLSFIFFSSSLSNAAQRFLAYAIGQNDIEEAKRIVGASLLIHISLAVIAMIVGEAVGLYLIHHSLKIPPERITAALWVYHLTILSLSFYLVGAVYESILIARENMRLYAYLGILEALLKLVLAALLFVLPGDKLELYAALFIGTVLILKGVLVLLVRRLYPEARVWIFKDKAVLARMGSFIGWNGFATLVWSINNQGTDVVLNIFFGPIVNAARGIANQINSAVGSFTFNFFSAVHPQIVKSYANGNIPYFKRLVFSSSRFGYYLMLMLSLPLMLRMDYVLKLWLNDVPAEASDFAIWILIYALVNVLSSPPWFGMQAVGHIRRFIIVGSIISMLALPAMYVAFLFGLEALWAIKILAAVRVLYVLGGYEVLCRFVSALDWQAYIKEVIGPVLAVSAIATLSCFGLHRLVPDGLWGLMLLVCLSTLANMVIIWVLGIRSNERTMALLWLKNKFSLIFRKR